MDSKAQSFSGTSETLAGDVRSVCHLVKSPMFSIFFALPRSECFRDGCLSSDLGRLSGFCISTLVPDTTGLEEAPIVLWNADDSRSSLVASKTLVSRAAGHDDRRACAAPAVSRFSQKASFSLPLSRDIQVGPSGVETLPRFAKSQGFSSRVAKQVGLARRPSSLVDYQSKWMIYRHWCHSEGHSISRPSLPKIVDFLFWLYRSRKLSVSAILRYRSMLAAIFCFKLPEISTSPILQDLLRSFKVEVPIRSVRPPTWDLEVVLCYLRSSSFEPCPDCRYVL